MSRKKAVHALLGFAEGFLDGGCMLVFFYAFKIKEIPLILFSGIIFAYRFLKVEAKEEIK